MIDFVIVVIEFLLELFILLSKDDDNEILKKFVILRITR